ncbi:ybeT, partial [Symbiodinium natans]
MQRCQACQYLPPHLSCTAHGKQQVAVIKHRQAAVGEGISNIMEVRIPGLYQNDTSVLWCPMLGMPDLADAEVSNEMQELITRKPVWNEQVQSLVLDFKGRVALSKRPVCDVFICPRKWMDRELDGQTTQLQSKTGIVVVKHKLADISQLNDITLAAGIWHAQSVCVTLLRRGKQGKARKEDQSERRQEESRADEESVLVDKKADVGQQSHQPGKAQNRKAGGLLLLCVTSTCAILCPCICSEVQVCKMPMRSFVLATAMNAACTAAKSISRSGLNGQRPKDAKEALHWYTLAAESGNAEAQNALALMLEDGADGVDQDLAAALRWHLAAAEKGNAVSQYCAACLLSRSGDVEATHKWLQLSADQGFRPAEQVLEEAELMPRDLPSQ